MSVFLDTKQVADRFGVAEKTLKRWRTLGIGPAYIRLGGRFVRYRDIDLEEYGRKQTFSSHDQELERVRAS